MQQPPVERTLPHISPRTTTFNSFHCKILEDVQIKKEYEKLIETLPSYRDYDEDGRNFKERMGLMELYIYIYNHYIYV